MKRTNGSGCSQPTAGKAGRMWTFGPLTGHVDTRIAIDVFGLTPRKFKAQKHE